MRVEFFKSDACAEAHDPDEPDRIIFNVPHNVQLTYAAMRTTRDWDGALGKLVEGDTFAVLTAVRHDVGYDDWQVTLQDGRILHFSDVIIGSQR